MLYGQRGVYRQIYYQYINRGTIWTAAQDKIENRDLVLNMLFIDFVEAIIAIMDRTG